MTTSTVSSGDGSPGDGKPRNQNPRDGKPDDRKPDDKPVLPVKSRDETDVGWGDPPEPDDEDRLRSERPPHWD
jgi:hypothetical protein